DQLAITDSADIGPSNLEYVTGTGANDIITITRNSATQATVTVQAFLNSDFTSPIPVPGPDPTLTTDTYTIDLTKQILVEAGAGSDRIVLDATLGSNIAGRGMAGDDQLVVLGNSVSSATYRPGDSAPTGLDGAASFQGSITAGATSISFSEFEPTGSVTIQNVPNVTFATEGLNGTDVVDVSSPAAGQIVVAGPSGGLSWVPLPTVNVGTLNLNTGNNDGNIAKNDTVPIHSLGAPVQVNTGAGDDTLVVDLTLSAPLPASDLSFDGG